MDLKSSKSPSLGFWGIKTGYLLTVLTFFEISTSKFFLLKTNYLGELWPIPVKQWKPVWNRAWIAWPRLWLVNSPWMESLYVTVQDRETKQANIRDFVQILFPPELRCGKVSKPMCLRLKILSGGKRSLWQRLGSKNKMSQHRRSQIVRPNLLRNMMWSLFP